MPGYRDRFVGGQLEADHRRGVGQIGIAGQRDDFTFVRKVLQLPERFDLLAAEGDSPIFAALKLLCLGQRRLRREN